MFCYVNLAHRLTCKTKENSILLTQMKEGVRVVLNGTRAVLVVVKQVKDGRWRRIAVAVIKWLLRSGTQVVTKIQSLCYHLGFKSIVHDFGDLKPPSESDHNLAEDSVL